MPLKSKHVLVVEDEPLLALDLATVLTNAGATPTTAASFEDALRHLEAKRVDACVADLQLWGHDITPLIEGLKKRRIPFVTYSGYADPPTQSVVAHVQKPKPADTVVEELKRLFSGAQKAR